MTGSGGTELVGFGSREEYVAEGEKKMGKQRSVGSQKEKEAKKCQGIDWAALKRGGGWRKAQLQVAEGTRCQEYRERGGEEPERGENPPSGSPG